MRFIICGFYFARGASCARAHAGQQGQRHKPQRVKREKQKEKDMTVDATVLTGHVVTAEETQSTLS